MSNFGLSNKDWKELIKLYPDIKIPYLSEADYYIGQLGKTDDTVYKKIMWYSIVKDLHDNVAGYKMKVADEVINELSNKYLTLLNSLSIPETKFQEKKLKLEDQSTYISIDLKEANYNSLKYALGLTDLPDTWGEYMRLKDYPELLVNSKTLRQLILGNINPKRQVVFQKQLICDLLLIIEKHDLNIASVSHDEVVIKIDKDNKPNILLEELKSFKVPLNIKEYTVSIRQSAGEEVILKHYGNTVKFHGIQGNRFFIHYSNLVLHEPLNEQDKYFEPEPGKLATWVIDRKSIIQDLLDERFPIVRSDRTREDDLLLDKMDEKILKLLTEGNYDSDFILETLSHLGYAPNLVYDDNGNWAVEFGGFQSVSFEVQDVEMHLFIEKDLWRPTIKEAVKLALIKLKKDS